MPLTRREFLIGSGVAAVVTSPLVKSLLKTVPEAKPVLNSQFAPYGSRVIEIWAEAVGEKAAKVSLRRPDNLLLQSYVLPRGRLVTSFPPGLTPISKGDITLDVEDGKGIMVTLDDTGSYHYITGGVYWEDA